MSTYCSSRLDVVSPLVTEQPMPWSRASSVSSSRVCGERRREAGRAELGAGGDDPPKPTGRPGRVTQPEPGHPHGLLEEAEPVLEVESPEEDSPQTVDVVRGSVGSLCHTGARFPGRYSIARCSNVPSIMWSSFALVPGPRAAAFQLRVQAPPAEGDDGAEPVVDGGLLAGVAWVAWSVRATATWYAIPESSAATRNPARSTAAGHSHAAAQAWQNGPQPAHIDPTVSQYVVYRAVSPPTHRLKRQLRQRGYRTLRGQHRVHQLEQRTPTALTVHRGP